MCSTELLDKIYTESAFTGYVGNIYKGIMIMFLFMLQGFILQLLYVVYNT